ncbi:MAG: hypothetical protein A2Y38_04535 [Spirochaetes bacterium GWB1_59_5]|nr:MAG: hypothetical protein A2Y38_04535 [Spirochaetes bacterium GWB1_59_5]
MAGPTTLGALTGLASPLSLSPDGSPAYASDETLLKQYVRRLVQEGGQAWFGSYLEWAGLDEMLFEYTKDEVLSACSEQLPAVFAVLNTYVQYLRCEGALTAAGDTEIRVFYRIRRTGEAVTETFRSPTW